jgi:hypothetical protein
MLPFSANATREWDGFEQGIEIVEHAPPRTETLVPVMKPSRRVEYYRDAMSRMGEETSYKPEINVRLG